MSPILTAPAFLPMLLVFLFVSSLAGQESTPDLGLKKINDIVNEFLAVLRMPQRVQVRIAPVNDKMISVERIHSNGEDSETFILCFDQEFLNSLNQQELRAGIAHELGHIWIFSHHPYLHTEALANEIAMRLVSREGLTGIYTKLWSHLGTSGAVDEFLGHATSSSVGNQ